MRCVRILLITTEPAFTCRWIGIHRIHNRYSPSAKSLRFQKSADFIIGTNVSPLD
jgi:hypothetical protein